MSIMDDFEGIKKIKNDRGMTIENIFEALCQYKEEIGTVELKEDKIIADIDGKYFIEVYINEGFIKIERVLEDGKSENDIELGTDLKSIDLAQADRMVDQIYDFINTIDPTGDVVEHITGVKKVLFVKQEEGKLRNHFYFTDENGEKKYEIKENKILKEFSGMNSETRMQEFTIQYRDMYMGQYSIIKTPYTLIPINKKKETVKTTFNGDIHTKNIQISADYSDNHYKIEVDEIVVGAIDSLNAETKDTYRIEINDLNYEYLIVALTVIIDMDYNN